MLKQDTADSVSDRRSHKRFRVRKGALAFFGAVPGEITDISLSGMSVKYVPLEQETRKDLAVDFFVPDQDFFLAGIPCHLVSAMDFPPDAPFQAVQVKRLGIKFGELTSEQRHGLRSFFQHNALPEA